MNGPVVEVIAPGLQTTVQDLGRWGHQADGVPVAGAMDPFAHRFANALVGNPRGAATFEITLTGPELRFGDQRWIAVTGAEFEVLLDGHTVPAATAVRTHAGSLLHFGARRSGARAYVAIAGGVDVAPVLGSRSTHIPSGMGGWEGRALRRGDRLPLGPTDASAPIRRTDPRGAQLPPLNGPATVRVLPGPQLERFADDVLDLLVSSEYTVGPASNRMGYRLIGQKLQHRDAADIVSDATPLGALQVPGSGQPVLLMADRQTTGGYAKLATVISADIPVAAQVAPGHAIAFQVCSREDAVRALVARERVLLALEPGGA